MKDKMYGEPKRVLYILLWIMLLLSLPIRLDQLLADPDTKIRWLHFIHRNRYSLRLPFPMSSFLSGLVLAKKVKSNQMPGENKTSIFQADFLF